MQYENLGFGGIEISLNIPRMDNEMTLSWDLNCNRKLELVLCDYILSYDDVDPESFKAMGLDKNTPLYKVIADIRTRWVDVLNGLNLSLDDVYCVKIINITEVGDEIVILVNALIKRDNISIHLKADQDTLLINTSDIIRNTVNEDFVNSSPLYKYNCGFTVIRKFMNNNDYSKYFENKNHINDINRLALYPCGDKTIDGNITQRVVDAIEIALCRRILYTLNNHYDLNIENHMMNYYIIPRILYNIWRSGMVYKDGELIFGG